MAILLRGWGLSYDIPFIVCTHTSVNMCVHERLQWWGGVNISIVPWEVPRETTGRSGLRKAWRACQNLAGREVPRRSEAAGARTFAKHFP